MVIPHPILKNFYTFENLTTMPYCRELIDLDIMQQDMIDFVNIYHNKVYKILKPLLIDDIRAIYYL